MSEIVRVTMMHWQDAPTPSGRSRRVFIRHFDGGGLMMITMVGEKSLWCLLQRRE